MNKKINKSHTAIVTKDFVAHQVFLDYIQAMCYVEKIEGVPKITIVPVCEMEYPNEIGTSTEYEPVAFINATHLEVTIEGKGYENGS